MSGIRDILTLGSTGLGQPYLTSSATYSIDILSRKLRQAPPNTYLFPEEMS